MGILDKITGILGGSVLGGVKDIIGQFHLSPEKKAELQAIVDQNAFVLEQKKLELESKIQDSIAREIEAASANIRAEAQSGDKYTSRARPSFIYVMLAIFIANFLVFPIIGRPPLSFPEPLFWLFGSCMLGYTGARTWERFAAIKNGNGKA